MPTQSIQSPISIHLGLFSPEGKVAGDLPFLCLLESKIYVGKLAQPDRLRKDVTV